MEKITLLHKAAALLAVVVAVAGLSVYQLLPSQDVAASGHTAQRSFSATEVAPGQTVTVSITADNYGRLGRIVEDDPAGFTTEDGSQTVTIRLLAAGPQTDLAPENESRPNVSNQGFWTRERGQKDWAGSITRQRRSSTS